MHGTRVRSSGFRGGRGRRDENAALRQALVVFAGLVAITACAWSASADEAEPAASVAQARRRGSEDLARAVRRGLSFLVRAQQQDGGWAGPAGAASDLATTSIAGLSLLRAGASLQGGTLAKPLAAAEAFVTDTLSRTDDGALLRPTGGDPLVRQDLGPGIDGILAGLFLAELVAEDLPAAHDARVRSGLERLAGFVARVQRQGEFDLGGSRAVSLALAARVLDRAEARGVSVDRAARHGLQEMAARLVENDQGSAWNLYRLAAAAGTLEASPPGSFGQNGGGSGDFIRPSHKPPVEPAGGGASGGRAVVSLTSVRRGIERAVTDPGWSGVQGSGGEIFLSEMIIGDVLNVTDSGAAPRWNGLTEQKLVRMQNGDGSWTGTSCISGRVFCTSCAIMAMMSDRIAPSAR